MVPLFLKESYPNSNADMSFSLIHLPWEEKTHFPLPLSLHIYSSQAKIGETENKPQASVASSCC